MGEVDHSELRAAVGAFGAADREPHPSLDQPLAVQVKRLMDWACSERPDRFRRSVPVDKNDHDVLITEALGALVRIVVEQANRLDELDRPYRVDVRASGGQIDRASDGASS